MFSMFWVCRFVDLQVVQVSRFLVSRLGVLRFPVVVHCVVCRFFYLLFSHVLIIGFSDLPIPRNVWSFMFYCV